MYNENYKTLEKSNNFKEFKDVNRKKLKTNRKTFRVQCKHDQKQYTNSIQSLLKIPMKHFENRDSS